MILGGEGAAGADEYLTLKFYAEISAESHTLVER